MDVVLNGFGLLNDLLSVLFGDIARVFNVNDAFELALQKVRQYLAKQLGLVQILTVWWSVEL